LFYLTLMKVDTGAKRGQGANSEKAERAQYNLSKIYCSAIPT
jgi:hypothetical protein